MLSGTNGFISLAIMNVFEKKLKINFKLFYLNKLLKKKK